MLYSRIDSFLTNILSFQITVSEQQVFAMQCDMSHMHCFPFTGKEVFKSIFKTYAYTEAELKINLYVNICGSKQCDKLVPASPAQQWLVLVAGVVEHAE